MPPITMARGDSALKASFAQILCDEHRVDRISAGLDAK